jgi:hypothetical protein
MFFFLSLRLIFIDLAGSERATDAQNNQRQTRREGAQINWSLLALKECIRSMDMTHSHAPFRQSKLTHILRDSLTGTKTRTCLMANVSPSDDCCQCSLNTLQYASRIRDISIRHRNRTMPMTNISMNYFDETNKEQEKTERNFKPATASTPVHRLISSVEQRIYTSTNSDVDTRLTKPLDIDWQVANDDDIPISGSGDNHPLKSVTSSTLEFMINSNNQHLNRFQTKKTNDIDESPSSYFPPPQIDIKKSSSIQTNETKRSFNSSRLMYDDGNERQWKTVPAPTTYHHSDSSIQPSNTTRIIPVAPIQISDENPYNSATGTESLGTKITKVATNDNQRDKKSNLIERLNLNKQYDTGTITTDTEQMIYSDRQTTPRDETGFFTNRDELLSIVSSRLTPVSKRSSSLTTPKNSKLNSSYSNKSKNSFLSPNKTRHKNRLIKSASSTTSLTSLNQDKKSSFNNKKPKIPSSFPFQKFDPTIRRSSNRHQNHHHHQRTVPLRVHHSSDSEEHDKLRHNIHRRKPYSSKNTSFSTRSEACQTTNEKHIMKNEQEQTDEKFLVEQKNINQNIGQSSAPLRTSLSSPVLIPSTSFQAPLDQVKLAFNRSLQQPLSPLSSANINNPWPISTSFSKLIEFKLIL